MCCCGIGDIYVARFWYDELHPSLFECRPIRGEGYLVKTFQSSQSFKVKRIGLGMGVVCGVHDATYGA